MIYLVQNDPRVPPGSFGEWLLAEKVGHVTVHAHAGAPWPETAPGDGVIVLGGYMGVDSRQEHPHLETVSEGLRRLLEREMPVLGICLGAQLLAGVLGAKVHADFLGERGTDLVYLEEAAEGDPLLAGIPAALPVLQWHQDSFELPLQAERLGWSPVCPNQIFRCGAAYGMQFHPEVTDAVLSEWVRLKNAPAVILERFAADREQYRRVAERLMGNFLALCESHG